MNLTNMIVILGFSCLQLGSLHPSNFWSKGLFWKKFSNHTLVWPGTLLVYLRKHGSVANFGSCSDFFSFLNMIASVFFIMWQHWKKELWVISCSFLWFRFLLLDALLVSVKMANIMEKSIHSIKGWWLGFSENRLCSRVILWTA